MVMGDKLRRTRLAAGLSQRQLCEGIITRNMLSQIENGGAQPSMDTLRRLSERLGQPMSTFLEDGETPEQKALTAARAAFAAGEYAGVLTALEACPRESAWEQGLLTALSCLALAEDALAHNRGPYARELLRRAREAGELTPYYTPAMDRERLLLLARLEPVELPADDRELLLRAGAALKAQDPEKARDYLNAAQNRDAPEWNFLMGQALVGKGAYAEALPCLRACEAQYPKAAAQFLEQCFRELGDYQNAYLYACRLRQW